MARHAPIDPAYREAATQIAHGSSLESAAREGGVDLEKLKTYRNEHPDAWERFVRVERRRFFELCVAEAILVLRKLMRSHDSEIALKATNCLRKVWMTAIRHGQAGGAIATELRLKFLETGTGQSG